MLGIYVENIVDMAIVECEGSIVRGEEAFKLRKAVISQAHARIVVIDLSEVRIIEGSGLGMLLFLHRWTQSRDIRLKLFNPTTLVKYTLEHANPTSQVDFATLDEMVALLARSDKRYAAAA
jgi:anti-anti-sigma regulatory factor